MTGKQLLIYTIYASLVIQLITGVITLDAVLTPVDKNNKILTDVAWIELVVQIIEATWYIVIVFAIRSLQNDTIAARRYIDWVITTPVMLLSTALFMSYKTAEKLGKTISTKEVLTNKKTPLIKIGIYNFLMLVFGYLGEVNILQKMVSIPLGFVFFALSFWGLYSEFVADIVINKYLFYFMFTVWGLYGVSAFFSVIPKNLAYNALDIISKNFYGIFIWYMIKTLHK